MAHVENVPQGYFLSLRVGSSRRQAEIVAGRTFTFSGTSTAASAAAGGSGLKVDILAVQGTTRIAASELVNVAENKVGEAVSVPVTIPQAPKPENDAQGPMKVVLNVKCVLDGVLCKTRIVLAEPGLSAEPAEAFEPQTSSPKARPPPSTLEAEPSMRTSRQNEACSYLTDHSIMPFVESMMRTLMQEQPADPWSRIASMLPADVQPQIRQALEERAAAAAQQQQAQQEQGQPQEGGAH